MCAMDIITTQDTQGLKASQGSLYARPIIVLLPVLLCYRA